MTLPAGLAFLSGTRPLDFGRRLCRLRWRKATRAREVREVSPTEFARDAFPSGVLTVVLDDTALPLFSGGVPAPGSRVLAAWSRAADDPPFLHTLRELEEAVCVPGFSGSPPERGAVSAIVFATAAFPPVAGETVQVFVDRLRRGELAVASDFGVLPMRTAFGPRPEVTRYVPRTARRLLDVGCGDGAGSAALKSANPALTVWGVERDPALAREASSRLDRVFEGEAQEVLSALAGEAARFDAFLFADVLEHLVDPMGVLSEARSLANSGATLVASVPNVGHLSVVRDLLLGRFDPVPAGLLDAGHLRWFTRRTLADVLEGSGWGVCSLEAERGATAPDSEAFLRWTDGLPAADRQSLQTYQWIAVARS